MSHTLHVVVTQDDIDHGVPTNIYSCALALALQRATGESSARMVSDCCRLSFDGPLVPVPPEVVKWRRDFDSHRPVSPFEFDLNIPDPTTPGATS